MTDYGSIPLTDALKAFIKSTQAYVNGVVRVKLFKGNIIVEGRKSANSLYDENLATLHFQPIPLTNMQLSDLSNFGDY